MNREKSPRETFNEMVNNSTSTLSAGDSSAITFTDEDMVNNPSHYQSMDAEHNIDCITAMQAAFGKKAVSIFCKLNVFKYTYRSPNKQPVESIKKAQWYLNKYMELAPEFMEEWRPSTDGVYEVSNLGNVRRIGSQENRKKVTLKNGYDTVMFSINGKVTCKYVHRLVAEAFIPNPNNYPEINHKNHIRTDNRMDNLEWCDRKQNVQDAIGIVLYVYNTDGDYLGKYNSIRDCEKEFGIGHRSLDSYIDTSKPKGNLLFYTSFKGDYLELKEKTNEL